MRIDVFHDGLAWAAHSRNREFVKLAGCPSGCIGFNASAPNLGEQVAAMVRDHFPTAAVTLRPAGWQPGSLHTN